MTTKPKLKHGQIWRNRKGRKVFVYRFFGPSANYPFDDGSCSGLTAEGNVCLDGTPTSVDLVELLVDIDENNPWRTDRRPTQADADRDGQVEVPNLAADCDDPLETHFLDWRLVKPGKPWRPSPDHSAAIQQSTDEAKPEQRTLTFTRYRDPLNRPTCAVNLNNGCYCPFLTISNFGTREHCFWNSGEQLERYDSNAGYLVPCATQCPIWHDRQIP